MPRLLILPEDRTWAHELWPVSAGFDADKSPVQEGAQFFFELRDAPDPFAADLFLDDLPLEALRPEGNTARWRWSPGFHAGSVEARLELGGGKRARFEIVTDPSLRKLTRHQFNVMVREILEDTFALFRISSFRTGVARGTGTRPPPIARLEFLRSRMPELVSVIQAIACNPQRALRPEEVSMPYHRATGAMGTEILRSFRSGRILSEIGTRSRLPRMLQGHLPQTIRLQRKASTFDIQEHRDIKASLRAWAAWLSAASGLLAFASEEKAELRQLQLLWAGRVKAMSSQLVDLLSLPLFADVSDQPRRIVLTSIYRNVPSYRKFFRLNRDFTLGIANVFGDFLQLPLVRTFDLYELWCFLRLLRAAVDSHGADPAAVDGLFSVGTRNGNVIMKQPAIVSLASGVALSFKLRFSEFWKSPENRGSYSRTMVPDMVLSGSPEDSSPLIVLDAKYRIDRALDDALASIHMYRDALVQDDSGGIKGIVRAAYLLTPHLPDGFKSDWKDEDMPGRLFHPSYRSAFRFGAMTLRPGMSMPEVSAALELLLEDARRTPRHWPRAN